MSKTPDISALFLCLYLQSFFKLVINVLIFFFSLFSILMTKNKSHISIARGDVF